MAIFHFGVNWPALKAHHDWTDTAHGEFRLHFVRDNPR